MIFSSISASGEGHLENISISADTVKTYDYIELGIPVADENRSLDSMQASIKRPDGRIDTVYGFPVPAEKTWKIRYSPSIPGKYTYTIRCDTKNNTFISSSGYFIAKQSTLDGFIRKSTNNPYYLVFDSGRPFFGIGHNLAWTINNSVTSYEEYFRSLMENGCNMTRIWINNPWTLRIDHSTDGAYNIKDSGKLDDILSLARQYGIYVVLTLDSYGSLMSEKGRWNEGSWKKNPYNVTCGGPCKTPKDFFTDPNAKKFYKDRLKYIVAHWGHSPNILAFELWNETNIPVEWAAEMSSYLKMIDPYKHLITTSLLEDNSDTALKYSIWGLDDIDLIQRHIYADDDPNISAFIISSDRYLVEKFKKPLFIGEFGMDADKSDNILDKIGVGTALHNSLWSSLVSGAFSGALNWWPEYVKNKKLYHHYQGFGSFVKGVDFNSKQAGFLSISPLQYRVINKPDGSSDLKDIVIRPQKVWGETAYKDFHISDNGNIEGGYVNYYLHGTSKKEIKVNPEFFLDLAEDGKLILHIDKVSQGGKLSAYLDKQKVLQVNLPAGPGKGPWKKSFHLEDYGIYQCVYDRDIEISVPKGKHKLKLINSGKDWIGIKSIVLEGGIDPDAAKAVASGIYVGDTMLIWIRNLASNGMNTMNSEPVNDIYETSFYINDLSGKHYEIEWWKTIKGKIITKKRIKAKDGRLLIRVPTFTRDIACKVRQID